jgi:hypothetical protein
MDQIYIWIFLLIIVIVSLDFSERFFKRKEEQKIKENFGTRWSDGPSSYPNYYEENRLIEYSPPITSNSVVLHTNSQYNANAQFSNFTTNGLTPPFLKCPSCELQSDCSNYPYHVDNKEGNVCSNCLEKIYYDKNNFPVFARANGRPRQCRNLISTQKATKPLWGTDARYLQKLQQA